MSIVQRSIYYYVLITFHFAHTYAYIIAMKPVAIRLRSPFCTLHSEMVCFNCFEGRMTANKM